MPFLLWSVRRSTTNSGSSSFPVCESTGTGHIVVEEIDGESQFPVTTGSGTGHVSTVRPIVIGAPIPRPRTKRIVGSGGSTFPVLASSGFGSIHLPRRTGQGASTSPAAVSRGTGRVLPRVSGTGTSFVAGALESFGSGINVGPVRISRTVAHRVAVVVDDYDGYVAPPQPGRRRKAVAASSEDELDELFLMGIL